MTIQHRPVDIEAASKLWRDDLSASQIASRFGVSRNVIVGIAFRNRAFFPEKQRSRSTRPEKAACPPRKVETRKLYTPHEAEPIPVSNYDAKRLPYAKHLVDLLPGECKWPLNNGGPYLFCAAKTAGKYCQHHQSRSLSTYRTKKQR
ncbi:MULTISPECIES: GcrA family cell cycle regulator [Sinorhizobium]|uniref:GcrA cell cycle regulator n=1 Tax=Sinorhizobium americanum TaxID=194963 RepID=A0A2S3YLH9_9HYPH|nr:MULTISPECIES: GcrA family cell cycle regulator [Sinorhizobium]PDT42020.1 GcrA cell cycle regulator [Sinorhizobium sp. FG01]POH28830.1 GcrA cell cycle regulator [Sinorhizobium americanum]